MNQDMNEKNINSHDMFRNTIFHKIIAKNKISIFRNLLKYNINPYSRNDYNYSLISNLDDKDDEILGIIDHFLLKEFTDIKNIVLESFGVEILEKIIHNLESNRQRRKFFFWQSKVLKSINLEENDEDLTQFLDVFETISFYEKYS